MTSVNRSMLDLAPVGESTGDGSPAPLAPLPHPLPGVPGRGSRPLAAATFWCVVLGIGFFACYGLCLRVTAARAPVPTVMFAWERYIPFVPAMIVPYMSIDLLFAASFFLCATRAELNAHVKRIVFAIVIACACFLLFPLQMGYARPPMTGFWAAWYAPLDALDRPYNLAPSLHLALRTILWVIYIRHTRGVLQLATKGWLLLIGLSTLLTYQHHVFDLVTGQALGLLALYVFPDAMPDHASFHRRHHLTPRPRMAALYACLGITLGVIGYLLRPWGFVLVWPAASMLIIAAAYIWLGPNVFRKRDGRLGFATRFALGPYLLGGWLTLPHYRRQAATWVEVTPQLILGRRLTDAEAREQIGRGVAAVLDLTSECAAPPAFRAIAYRNIPVLDLTVPTPRQLDDAVAFIRAHAHDGRKVYLHCKLGRSRSAAVAAAYLIAEGIAPSAAEAVERVRRVRPEIVVGAGTLAALERYAQQRREQSAST